MMHGRKNIKRLSEASGYRYFCPDAASNVFFWNSDINLPDYAES